MRPEQEKSNAGMHRRTLKSCGLGLIAVGVVFGASACFFTSPDDCANKLVNCPSATSGSTSSSTSTGGGGTGGAPPNCEGDPSAENVIDACGVFVQADATGAIEDGTSAHPYKKLQTAIDNAGTKRVYACASAPYEEAVTIATPVAVYGGFECSKGWTWNPQGRSALNGPAGAVALALTKPADGVKVQGFSITTPSATTKGESSVAVAVDAIAAALMSCEVTAGDGMPGDDGVTPAGTATKGDDAPLPVAMAMNACINAASLVGGAAGTQTCGDGVTAGGVGGKGGITAMMSGYGAAGTDGTPADAIKGKGGTGEDALNDCSDGTKGKSGGAGSAGDAGSLPGMLSITGISDTNMTDGKPGSRGNGGGGGGGAKSGMFCFNGTDGNGASGGGGGAGGCGGTGGGGGKAGGSSIAIVSLGTKLTLTEVSLKTGKGGDGGQGALGQSGGDFGAGAKGGAASGLGTSKPGCKGGDGGLGGSGGPGGGGRGGHSLGIAYVNGPSAAPTLKGFAGNTAGASGTAGDGSAAGKGAPGAVGPCWDFGKNASCAQ